MEEYERGEVLEGETHKMLVGCGCLYVTLNVKKDERYTEYPLDEIWITPSFKDKEALYCCKTFLVPIARLTTFIVRRLEKKDRGAFIKQLYKHECPKRSVVTARSCVDAVARVLMCYWDGHKWKNGRCWVCAEREEKE